MTSKVDFLPFVDGIPEDGQRRLSWIRNGDLLNGSDTKYGHEGNLNEVGVQLQQNIVFLAKNIDLVDQDTIDIKKDIAEIQEILGDASSGSLIETVNEHTAEIKTINENLTQLTEDFNEDHLKLNRVLNDVGTRTSTNGPNSIFGDLIFIKTRIGNNAGEDINGLPTNSTDPATGLFLKVNEQGTIINKHTLDIASLTTRLDNSKIDELHESVDSIRLELGPKPTPNSTTVYDRLTSLESSKVDIDDQLSSIEEKIGPDKIIDKVNQNTTDINTVEDAINNPTSGIKKSVKDLQTSQDALLNDVIELTTNVETNTTKIGNDASGLIKDVNLLNKTVGIGQAEPTSLITRTANLETVTAGQTTTLQDIEVILGTSTTGLQGDVANINKTLNGDPSSSDPIAKSGLVLVTGALVTKSNSLQDVQDKLVLQTPYGGKTFVLMGDATTNVTAKNVADLTFMVPSTLVTKGTTGAGSISGQSDYTEAKKADVILVNISTYDYLFNRELGVIADAVDGTTANSFYADVYKLLSDVSSGTSRVLVSTGYRSKGFKDSTVNYPNQNGVNKTYKDYVSAVVEVADILGLPVIDTHNQLGINVKNIDSFTGSTGLTTLGVNRFSTLVAKSLR